MLFFIKSALYALFINIFVSRVYKFENSTQLYLHLCVRYVHTHKYNVLLFKLNKHKITRKTIIYYKMLTRRHVKAINLVKCK